ncbi:hypothetical protein ACH5RR_001396 [Cinchona calisaya]|uniref:Uncharacterized protein n=1 Tax=Cinchona calisaya TaxID=153742 RepID=A0ABD3B3D6_9GENT
MENPSHSIQLFWSSPVSIAELLNSEQLLHVKINSPLLVRECIDSFVYGKTTTVERREIWAVLHQHRNHTLPWVVARDFNVVCSMDEYLGSFPQIFVQSVILINVCMIVNWKIYHSSGTSLLGWVIVMGVTFGNVWIR